MLFRILLTVGEQTINQSIGVNMRDEFFRVVAELG